MVTELRLLLLDLQTWSVFEILKKLRFCFFQNYIDPFVKQLNFVLKCLEDSVKWIIFGFFNNVSGASFLTKITCGLFCLMSVINERALTAGSFRILAMVNDQFFSPKVYALKSSLINNQ